MIGAWLAAPVPPGQEGLRSRVPERLARWIARAHIRTLATPAVDGPDSPPLEVFLRTGPRDLDVVTKALVSIKRYMSNPIGRLVAATPRVSVAQVQALMPDAEVWADEDLIDPDIAKAIAAVAPKNREGWLRQQFLNLNYVSRHARGPCLVWDADTVMMRPQQLMRGHRARLAISIEHHFPYFTLTRSLLPDLPMPVHTSMVAHHQVFDPDLLRELFTEIERGPGGAPWWRAILSQIKSAEQSPFADYELYGQWIRQRHPDRIELVGFRNTGVARQHFSDARARAIEQRGDLDSVSLHWWIEG